MPDGGRRSSGGRNAERLKVRRAEEVRTEAKAEGKEKCEPRKSGKPKVSRKLRNKPRASGRKEHKAREDRADSLGRAKAGNRLDTSEGWC